MEVSFIKMHGIGNDFIIMDFYSRALPEGLNFGEVAKKLCDRHFGIGADGLIVILPSEIYDLRMRIFNSDGSEAQMCGNGIRCFAKFAYENTLTRKNKFSVETLAGEIIPELIFDEQKTGTVKGVRVDMGKPHLMKKDIPMIGNPDRQVINETISLENGQYFRVSCVSMGNPHCIIFTEDVEIFPVTEIGPVMENHHLFPEKTNVEFVQPLNDHEIKLRVWERGVGETMACGTGASAAVVAGVLNKRIKNRAVVYLKGGNLKIEWTNDEHVYMTGPAEAVFSGIISI
ncbi:MAG: diaminopimelate epimerase [Atribacterota bacterium]|nr:diaminopimelate epimerase [Atribacterota bacterium]MDD4895161.1 diaminopimelate epimerase [Atribacterota bacterium]MDD5637190.1 diaminopimelate epimerase [Atribacterota bacterium]